jgi:N-acetylmuramoyl-L-alanine amidase
MLTNLNRKIKIFIDPGHGGRDPGTTGGERFRNEPEMWESNINLDVSHRLREILFMAGFEIMMSRTDDRFIEINDRWRMANNWGADLFISIHVNAGGGTGFETLYFREDSYGFARTIQDHFSRAMGLRNRRVWHRANVGVIRHTNMRSILPELAFLDALVGAPDIDMLRNRRQEMAQALADGIFAYTGIDPKAEPAPPAEQAPPHTPPEHWAEAPFQELLARGLTIHERRFDDTITRGEIFALLVRFAAPIEQSQGISLRTP